MKQDITFGQTATLSPTDRYKQLIIKLVEDSITFDCELDKRKFIKSVKGLLVILRHYYPVKLNDLIRERITEMNEKVGAIEKKKLNESQKKTQITNLMYDYYEDLFVLCVDVINNSPIVEKEVEGVLVYSDMEELKEVAKNVKKKVDIEDHEGGE